MGADKDMVSQVSFPPFRSVSASRTAAEGVVDKHNPMGDHALLSNRNALTEKGVGLDVRTTPDSDPPLDLHERPHKNIIP